MMFIPSRNHKPTMNMMVRANNLHYYEIKVNLKKFKKLQSPPILWSDSHYSSLTMRQYKYRLFDAHISIMSIITPTLPPQYLITN
jgi:hypothetical protein